MIKVLSDSMEKVGSKDKSGVVDVKGVGKPEDMVRQKNR